jgi:hypothetical protein
MKTRTHGRAPDKIAFSIAMPLTLKADLDRIAAAEHRNRNGQIVHFLAEASARYKLEHPEAFRKTGLYSLPEPDLDKDIAAEPPPPPYGQSQSQSQSQSQGEDDLPPPAAPVPPKKPKK